MNYLKRHLKKMYCLLFVMVISFTTGVQAGVDSGQIVEIQEGQIDVATGEGLLSLKQFKDLNGKVITPGELQTQFKTFNNQVQGAMVLLKSAFSGLKK